jgi:type IV secretory pathway VirB10-like protein
MAGLAEQKSFCGAAIVALFAASLTLAATLAGNAFAQDSQSNARPPGAAAPAQMAPQPPAPAPASPQPPTAAAPLVPPPPGPANRPGFLYQLKVWWDDSVALFDTKSKDARGTADDTNKKPDNAGGGAADAAKDAAKNAAAATQDAMKGAVEATKGAATTATDAMKGAMEATKNAATAIVRLPNTRFVGVHETCARAPNGASDCAAAAANGCRTKGFNGGTPLDVRTAEKCDTKPPQAGQMPGVQCAPETVVIRAVCQ